MPKVNDEYPGKKTMNDELKQRALDKYNKEDKSTQSTEKVEHKFPTEIVDLPSRGLIYPKENSTLTFELLFSNV